MKKTVGIVGVILILAILGVIALGGDDQGDDDETGDNAADATHTPNPLGDPPIAIPDHPTDGSFDPATLANPQDVIIDNDTANYYGWQFFLYVNNPSSIPGAVLWQTWKQSTDVYLTCGAQPAPWGQTTDVPSDVLTAAEEAGLADDAAFYTYIPFTQEIDGRELLDTNNVPVRYEVRMNQSTFTTIYNLQLYNRDTQVAFFENSSATPLQFQTDALEVKATWRVFATGESTAGFYTTIGYYYDNGVPVVFTAGLTGLHITSKMLPDWLWITFEQKDNQQTTQAPVIDPISPDAQYWNNYFHSQLPSDSVWQNYNMRGTQWTFREDMASPTILANTQIETYFQASSSCMTCHFLATIGSENDGRMPFFAFEDGNLAGYIGDPTLIQFQLADGTAVNYNGNFGFTDTSGILRYKQLDFVWSLREAQPSCPNN